MPGFDKTGPQGQGSMTGRRMGRCTDYGRSLKKTDNNSSVRQTDGLPDNLPGRGIGRGQGRSGSGRNRGRGMGRQNRLRSNS